MLIPSERHTPEDLTLWAELEAADHVHGERLLRSGKVEDSLDAIRAFVAAGTCYAGWSGGKDSTVLVHLLCRAAVDVPIWHVHAEPVANPETKTVRQAVETACPGLTIRVHAIRYSRLILDGRDNPEGDRQFFAAFRRLGDRHISGIRADESGGRKIRMRNHGLSTPNSCAPLGWWTGADCFGYLATHGLPVHPSYAMLGGGRWDRRHVRVDELAGSGGNQFGRAEWEREYYGDVLRRLEAASGR